MSKIIDLTDRKLGYLTVIGISNKKGNNGELYWECMCGCGKTFSVLGRSLRNGDTRSCGCLHKKIARAKATIHGMRFSAEYKTWAGMKQRCTNKNNQRYQDYGGRGIAVCKRWLKFENFFEDMGKKPEGFTIERTDNNKGYFKENCKWATQTEQSRNQRVSKRNKTGYTGVSWYVPAKKYCVKIMVDYKRIHLGYFKSLQEAIFARQQGELKYWNSLT